MTTQDDTRTSPVPDDGSGGGAPATDRSRRQRWFGGKVLRNGSRIYWWREILIIAVLDIVYETVRNISSSKPDKAYANALRLIDWQRNLGLWHELGIQQWALGWTPLIVFANYFYGSIYIAATVFGLVFLYVRFSDDYPLFRNMLAITTMLGLVGFATFPLMPPRLLDDSVLLNGINSGRFFGFVDTLVQYPTFWSFNDEAMKTISNQFAAMPSLHCAWAFWGCALFLSRVRSWWAKSLAALYPAMTIFVVVITGNHYFLDAVGGLVIFGIGWFAAHRFTRAGRSAQVDQPRNSIANS